MKKERALLLVNPMAGQRKAKTNLFAVIEILSSKYMLTVHLTESSGDAYRKTLELKDEFKTIFCCGGDGTLSQVVNGCADPDDPRTIGYIPCGTANDVARTLKLPKNMSACARKIVNAKANFHDAGMFCGNTRFIYVASFGAFTKSSYDTPQAIKNALGQSAYVLNGAKELMNIKKIATEIVCDDKELTLDDVALLSVCNTKSTGGIIKFPDKKVALNDGKLELLVVRYPKNINMLNDIFAAISRQKFDPRSENVMLMHGRHFEIRTKGSVAWTLDGENAGEHTNVVIDCVKSAVKILY